MRLGWTSWHIDLGELLTYPVVVRRTDVAALRDAVALNKPTAMQCAQVLFGIKAATG